LRCVSPFWSVVAVRRRAADRGADSVGGNSGGSVGDIVVGVTMSISITLDDELGEELNAAIGGGNRSAVVAEAIRDYLDRRAVAAAAAWHASLTGEDAATLAAFNAEW
jgi:Arc/MetJ-type ribon-helix-helix transcriptional regulator